MRHPSFLKNVIADFNLKGWDNSPQALDCWDFSQLLGYVSVIGTMGYYWDIPFEIIPPESCVLRTAAVQSLRHMKARDRNVPAPYLILRYTKLGNLKVCLPRPLLSVSCCH